MMINYIKCLTGNHLGEEGIAAVTKLMRDMFKLDELGSFRYLVSYYFGIFRQSSIHGRLG